MAKVIPWSVKGVEPEAREAAKIAARRAGMTLGQWLNNTIRAAAAQQLATTGRALQPSDATDLAPYDADQRSHPPAPTSESILENLLNLSNRIDRTEQKTEATVAPLASRVQQLSGQLEQVFEQVEKVRSQATVSTAPVERAMQRLCERLEKIEAGRKTDKDTQKRSLFGRDK
jgi:localization factor PodJL